MGRGSTGGLALWRSSALALCQETPGLLPQAWRPLGAYQEAKSLPGVATGHYYYSKLLINLMPGSGDPGMRLIINLE